ncbi:MAG: tRNA 4-thiouridine(8) synthase ThiI [Gemmatimonadetes bacterium]|nr:tRNA 4-thiouridine(8) synthase ThiI [Gemmatimonadota bacterium]
MAPPEEHLETGAATAAAGELTELILLRSAAELTLKSRRTRSRFQAQLLRNLRDALGSAGAPYRLEPGWDRIYVRTTPGPPRAVLPRVFGLSSFSPIAAVARADLEEIVATGEARFRERVRGRSFAVRARRTGQHDFTSQDIQVRLGAALRPHARTVDLEAPEVTVHVEVRERDAYLFTERVAGAGGLPLGVEGRGVSLISGGYDSAVAAWLLLKRGVALDYVFCNLGGDAYERAVVQVAKVLADDWHFGTRPKLHVVDFDAPLAELRSKVKPSYWQVVLKRLMYRTASRIGAALGAEAIVTGEAVGQVSSQTLTNLRAIEPAAELPVFRPLLGFDKEEIIARARTIGTAALSEQVKEYCAIAPGKPVTAASVQAVDREEARLELAVIDAAVAAAKVLDLRALTATDLVAPYLFAAEIPPEAVVLDCRPAAQYHAWHLPGAEHRDEWELLQSFKRLDKKRTYILYCQHGIQSAYLAERMQRAGYEAYSFRGGARGIMKYAQARGS